MSSYLYIPAPKGQQMSQALWCLELPPDVQQATTALWPVKQAEDESLWLRVDPEATINVHPQAILNGIADILQPFIDNGALPPNTNADLAAYIESKRGDRIVVYDAFPQYFKDQARTLEQMIADGLFPPNPTP